MGRAAQLLIVTHVPWEGPHRIADAFASMPRQTVDCLAGGTLPPHSEVAGALFMGGPMNVDETERHPGLAAEREWLAEAARLELPVLGICLGAQLLARALGAEVRRGERPEIGFAPIEVLDPEDQVLGALAPRATVLHWHGDVLDLPDGAARLASSERTENQAFRYGNAWGVLFHPEADAALLDAWLAVPPMTEEARRAIGAAGAAELLRRAREIESDLVRRSTVGFQAFAELVASRARPLD